MKTKATLVLFFALVFWGCEKDDDNAGGGTPVPPPSSWSFSAKVNGNLVQADSLEAALHVDTSLGLPLRILAISAVCDTQLIAVSFSDTINSTLPSVANYPGPFMGMAFLSYYCMSDTINEYISSNAQINITSVNASAQTISGTFSGTVVGDVTGDTYVITNGVFNNIHYEVW